MKAIISPILRKTKVDLSSVQLILATIFVLMIYTDRTTMLAFRGDHPPINLIIKKDDNKKQFNHITEQHHGGL
jgi:hypothetical protein